MAKRKTKLAPKRSNLFGDFAWLGFTFKEQMRDLKNFYRYGHLAALRDAFVLVQNAQVVEQVVTPEWMMDGAIDLISERLKAGASLGRGSSGKTRRMPNRETSETTSDTLGVSATGWSCKMQACRR